ncbi:MAG: hypothetical protein IJ538_03600 [Clostridia bacterium]|nr:hypothetical protein [Clostridia bacterium]
MENLINFTDEINNFSFETGLSAIDDEAYFTDSYFRKYEKQINKILKDKKRTANEKFYDALYKIRLYLMNSFDADVKMELYEREYEVIDTERKNNAESYSLPYQKYIYGNAIHILKVVLDIFFSLKNQIDLSKMTNHEIFFVNFAIQNLNDRSLLESNFNVLLDENFKVALGDKYWDTLQLLIFGDKEEQKRLFAESSKKQKTDEQKQIDK